MREEKKEIDRKLYKILGYEKCSEADQAIEKIKDLLSSQLEEVLERTRPKHKDMTYISECESTEEFNKYYYEVQGWNQCVKNTDKVIEEYLAEGEK